MLALRFRLLPTLLENPRLEDEKPAESTRVRLLGGWGWGMGWRLARLAHDRLRLLVLQANPSGRQDGHAIKAMPHLHRHFAAEAPLLQCLQWMCKHLPCGKSVLRAMSLVALHK